MAASNPFLVLSVNVAHLTNPTDIKSTFKAYKVVKTPHVMTNKKDVNVQQTPLTEQS